MDEIINEVQTNASAIMSTFIMIIGIVTGLLSASDKKNVQIWGNVILAIIYVLLTHFIYQNLILTKWTFVLASAWVCVWILLVWKREIISRSRLDKMIRKFTAKADYCATLCIFGGDLDFFGNVSKPKSMPNGKVKYERNDIRRNKQFLQLKAMKFHTIHILCLRPVDLETRLRIGFLKQTLGDTIAIKFVEEKECSDCTERSSCLACSLCNDCPEDKGCKRVAVSVCNKLASRSQYSCYNPDTKLRGRIARLKGTGATSVAIVTTQIPGKSYFLNEYSSNTKECTIYQTVWNVWWKKCKGDQPLVTQCQEEYIEFSNSNNGEV